MKPANPRGLIFTGELIPGVMSGAITVTSRIMKPQPPAHWSVPPARLINGRFNRFGCEGGEEAIPCPFRVGEKRYVKEAWGNEDGCLVYRADLSDWSHLPGLKWRNPMFMPKRCARTWIEILSVKPVRCQEITREEILASGIVMDPSGAWCQGNGTKCYETSRDAYAALWQRLNGAKRGFPWSANCWVWRICFRLTEAAALAALKGASDGK